MLQDVGSMFVLFWLVSDVFYGGEIQIPQNNLFFTFLQLFSPFYYLKFFLFDNTKSSQHNFGNMVDKEIIDNISKDNIL